MAKGKVEIEIYRAWEGYRWNWNVWIDREPYKHGVEDTAKAAMDAALKAYIDTLRPNKRKEGGDD